MAAICAAPTIFGHMGILKGKHATCYPGMEDELEGAILSGNPVVTDKNIITSRGMGTAIDFGLKLVEVLVGGDKANEIGKSIVHKRA